MDCKKCNNDLFKIIICLKCEDCKSNGAYDEEIGYIYDDDDIFKKKLERTEAFDEGHCLEGEARGNGCYIFKCSKCNYTENMPLVED